MDFFDVVDKRSSIRSFSDQEIKPENVRKILEAANSAPSAGNLQAYEIVSVTSKEKKKELASAAFNQLFIISAPVVLIFFAHPGRSSGKYGSRGKNLYCIQDATISAAYAQLTATALGLSAVWVGAFDPEDVSEILNAPSGLKPVAILPIGHPTRESKPTSRRSLDDLVKEEGF